MTNHCRFTFVVLTEMSDPGVQHYHIYWFKHIVLVDCAVQMFCVKYRKMEAVGFYYSNTSHYDLISIFWFHWGSNSGLSACNADMLTTTLWNHNAEEDELTDST